MKCYTRKVLQQIIVLHLIFKIRRQTTKYIKKLLRIFIVKVARSANKKCSGTRMEVSGSHVVGWFGVGKGDERGLKEHRYVHMRLQRQSRGLWAHFPALF